jgi:hypothetical protein
MRSLICEDWERGKAMQRGLGGFPHERLHQEGKGEKGKGFIDLFS